MLAGLARVRSCTMSRRAGQRFFSGARRMAQSSSYQLPLAAFSVALVAGFGGMAAMDQVRPRPSTALDRRHGKNCPCAYPHDNHPCTCKEAFVPGCHELLVFSGSSNRELTEVIGKELGTGVGKMNLGRFMDGEVSVQVGESVRGKDVYIVQGCSPPVNDNVIEMLLLVSTMRRASAKRVTCVIPYFAYKHHRRGSAIETEHGSRFLHSNAADMARMLEVMGVDRVIAVDLQRPGQGHEACFFSNMVPVETLETTELGVGYFADYFLNSSNKPAPAVREEADDDEEGGKLAPKRSWPPKVVIVSPNSELVKKARKFQVSLRRSIKDVGIAAFVQGGPDMGELMGSVDGCEVVIVDDLIDTAGTLTNMAAKLKKAGATRVYAFAAHGLFSGSAQKMIEHSQLEKVVVMNTIPLPLQSSKHTKIHQIDVGPMLAKLIKEEHYKGDERDQAKKEKEMAGLV